MSTPSVGPITLTVNLDDCIATAFERAAKEAMMPRAGLARRMIAEALRASGYLPPLPAGRPAARSGAAR